MRCLTFAFLVSAFLLGCDARAPASEDAPTGYTNDAETLSTPNSQYAGLTHLYFDKWSGPEISVWLYVPRGVDVKTAPIMFMMHGAKRGAARYLSEWDQIAEDEDVIVVAPEFNKENFPTSATYNRGNVYANDALSQNPEENWTFSAIQPVFDHIVALLQGEQNEFMLYGHSAGSQFAHRFMYFKPNAPVSRFLAANAGWYTFADLDIPYPYGLGGTGLTEADVKSVLEKDVVVLLGDADTDANHSSLRRSDGALAQGEHRFERGFSFYENARANAEKVGADFGWRIHIVEGVAHSNGGMAEGARGFLDE